jgi:hypothetical protein
VEEGKRSLDHRSNWILRDTPLDVHALVCHITYHWLVNPRGRVTSPEHVSNGALIAM